MAASDRDRPLVLDAKSTPTSVPNGLRRHFVATEPLATLAAALARRLRPRRRPHATAERDDAGAAAPAAVRRTRRGLSREVISHFDDLGPAWAWSTLTVGEHVGTTSTPRSTGSPAATARTWRARSPAQLVAPAAVIDKSAEAAEDPNYLLTLADIQAWENEHGPLPPGGWLLLRTGWDAAPTTRRRSSTAPRPPGPDAEAARWLAEVSPIVGVGVRDRRHRRRRRPLVRARRSRSTTSCSGRASTGSRSWRTSPKLPPQGAIVVVAPLKLVGGTGSPSRVFALV